MVEGNLEQKQRVNLSSIAKSVLENDFQVFGGGSFSGFMNRLITEFSPRAEASVDAALEQRHRELEDRLSPTVLEAVLEEYRRELLRKQEAWPQGDSVTFRLNNQNFSLLYDDRAEGENYDAPSKYLKALLEEYARLSPCDRERVCFAREIETVIEPAIAAGYPLEITVSGKACTVRPYAVTADAYGAHMYLIGYSRRAGEEEERIASFRISRLERLKLGRRSHRAKLTRDEMRDIEKKLRRTGVQYLVGQEGDILLRLTEAGQREFSQRSYMRPNPDSVSGALYRFSCTERQIRNYFFSFGKEVQILEPESLRREFLEGYRSALAAYE